MVYDRDDIQTSHNPFFDAVLRGVEPAARGDHYNLNVVYFRRHPDGDVRTIEGIDSLKRNAPEGMLLDASVFDRPLAETVPDLGIPTVLVDNAFPDDPVDAIAIDNWGGTMSAFNHLLETGHSEIGLLSTSIPTRNFNERRTAFAQVLAANAMRPAPDWDFALRPTQEGAYEDIRRELESNPQLPSALFAANDIIAFGAIRALKERGVRIPDDLSIVGFDTLALTICRLST